MTDRETLKQQYLRPHEDWRTRHAWEVLDRHKQFDSRFTNRRAAEQHAIVIGGSVREPEHPALLEASLSCSLAGSADANGCTKALAIPKHKGAQSTHGKEQTL